MSTQPATTIPTTPTTPSADTHLLELAEGSAQASASNGRSWLRPMRQMAVERFKALGLPTLRDEDWRKTDLRPLKRTRFMMPDQVPAPDAAAVRDRVAELAFPTTDEHRLVFINGRFAAEHSAIGQLPDGVRVVPLGEAMSQTPDDVQAVLGGIAPWRDEPFLALNSALFQDGAWIVVPDGTVVEQPVHLLFLAAPGDMPVLQSPRVMVQVGTGARATVLETFAPLHANTEYLTNAVTEASVADRGHLNHYKRQQESEAAFHVGRVVGRQVDESTFASYSVALGGRIARSDTMIDIHGEHCETLLKGLYMARGQQHLDNLTRLDHAVANCHSHERYKGILDDRSSAVFTGRIEVHQDAQKTDAIQENSALLLSRDATINTQPQLEIFADDVKCTHGATVGELPDSQLFYLRTRGIPEAEARGILTYAYANEIIDEFEIEPLRAELEQLIRGRMRERFGRVG